MSETVNALVVLKSLEKQAKSPMTRISNLSINTTDDFNAAAQMLKSVKHIAKEAKEKELELTEPLTKLLKDVRALFKPFRDSVDALEADTKSKMNQFLVAQKIKAQKLEADFESGKIKKISTVVSKVNALNVTSEDAQIRKVWTAIEVDGDKTPREYMVPDTAKIKEALKAGKSVAGWKWEQVDSIAI